MSNYRRNMGWLIAVATLVRLIPAFLLDLGNDEVYYWLYSVYPALSHFDHPAGVGLLIDLTTLNNSILSDGMVRLGAVICGSINLWLIYRLGKSLHSERAGWFAALLYLGSVYFSIISGLFILPDSPQVLFWMLALTAMVKGVRREREIKPWLWAGLWAGAGVLCKYHTLLIWGGPALVALFYRRRLLRNPGLYLGVLITLIFTLPIILWNARFDFISFTFHGDRVSLFESFNSTYFSQFFLGQILYQNPINVILIVAMGFISRRWSSHRPLRALLIWTALPMILLFTFFSFSRFTLPHWSGPAFIGLNLLLAIELAHRYRKSFPGWIKASLWLFGIVLALGTTQILTGFIPLGSDQKDNLGKGDITLDMYGWDRLAKESHTFLSSEFKGDKPTLISHRWFPAAHFDRYLCQPYGYRLLAFNRLERIHKYAWINLERGGLRNGEDAVALELSDQQYQPCEKYSQWFESCEAMGEVYLKRGDKRVRRLTFFRMKNFRGDTSTFTIDEFRKSSNRMNPAPAE